MKVLITGYNGMLGRDMFNVLNNESETIGVDIEEFDITNINDCISYIRYVKPNILINCAAYTDVDGCETEIELAYTVNALGTRNLAIACNEVSAAMVHISTDYVFDGLKGRSYVEDDMTNPINEYGKSKLAGEKYVQALLNRHYIIRTQWLYGQNGKNFVKTMLSMAKKSIELRVVNDQFGCPTYTLDLAHAITELIKTSAYGKYHITNNGIISWFDFAEEILQIAMIQGAKIIPIKTEEMNRPAQRPKYSPLENFNWKISGHTALRSYKDALTEYIKENEL